MPTARLPVARRPMYAVATTVTAFAASESTSPTANARSSSSRPTTRNGKSGIDQSSGQPTTAAPVVCWSSTSALAASETARQPAAIATQPCRNRQTAAPTASTSRAAAPAGPNETEISSRDSA